MTKAIYFDMDGTIANLYGVEGWLDDILTRNVRPYREANTMVRMNALAKILNNLQRDGYTLGIVSWLAKNSTEEYDERVRQAKQDRDNLEIEIKDDGSALNINQESREKDVIKDDLMKSLSNLVDYIKIINKNQHNIWTYHT